MILETRLHLSLAVFAEPSVRTPDTIRASDTDSPHDSGSTDPLACGLAPPRPLWAYQILLRVPPNVPVLTRSASERQCDFRAYLTLLSAWTGVAF